DRNWLRNYLFVHLTPILLCYEDDTECLDHQNTDQHQNFRKLQSEGA
ncbi:hypothetical protein GWI33_009700, partial [Rhynchophorus ferrugineus]